LNLEKFDIASIDKLLKGSKKFINSGMIIKEENFLTLTRNGKLLADGIAADLFF
jgi:oxygen-independent coproporphyrinogen III oxidase